MKKASALLVLLFSPILLLTTAARSDASSITYQLDCYFNTVASPQTCVALGFSYGTVTITDDPVALAANQVQLTLDLDGTAFRSEFLYLNYSFDANSGNTLASSLGTISVSQNVLQADGYNTDFFDVSITGDPIKLNSWVTTLTATGGASLDPVDFDLLTFPKNALRLAVHVQKTNCANINAVLAGCVPSDTASGEGSLWIGSTGLETNQLSSAPEPASLVLFGTGLAGLVVLARRARRT